MTALCPRCGATAPVKNGRFRLHGAPYCPLSEMPVPATGTGEVDFHRRAHIVAELAGMQRDYDPATVWDYATAVDACELQRLLMVALAAIDVEKTVDELWGWVAGLPAARCSA